MRSYDTLFQPENLRSGDHHHESSNLHVGGNRGQNPIKLFQTRNRDQRILRRLVEAIRSAHVWKKSYGQYKIWPKISSQPSLIEIKNSPPEYILFRPICKLQNTWFRERRQKFQKIFSEIKQRIENSKMYGQSRLTGSLREKELRAGQVSTTGAGSSHLLISKNN